MSEWLLHQDYAEVWQCYAHLPVRTMTAAEVMEQATPGSGHTWTHELHHLWTEDQYDTLLLLQHVASDGCISEPIIIGSDGRLWDGHHRLAVALALQIPVPVRVVPQPVPPCCCATLTADTCCQPCADANHDGCVGPLA